LVETPQQVGHDAQDFGRVNLSDDENPAGQTDQKRHDRQQRKSHSRSLSWDVGQARYLSSVQADSLHRASHAL
jgi:hypothetical protein